MSESSTFMGFFAGPKYPCAWWTPLKGPSWKSTKRPPVSSAIPRSIIRVCPSRPADRGAGRCGRADSRLSRPGRVRLSIGISDGVGRNPEDGGARPGAGPEFIRPAAADPEGPRGGAPAPSAAGGRGHIQRLLSDIPSVSVQGYTMDGTTFYWNKASEQLYGYTQQEAVGKSLLALIIPPDMHRQVEDSIARMVAQGVAEPAAEFQLMRKDGTLVDVFSSHALLQWPGTAPQLFCLDIDISERKIARQLRLAASVFTNASEPMLVTDADRRIIRPMTRSSTPSATRPRNCSANSPAQSTPRRRTRRATGRSGRNYTKRAAGPAKCSQEKERSGDSQHRQSQRGEGRRRAARKLHHLLYGSDADQGPGGSPEKSGLL